MKTLVISTLALLSALTVSRADIAVYIGSSVVKTTSQSGSGTRVLRVADVVDLATGNVVTITVSGSGKSKTATASDPVQYALVQTADSRTRKTYTVLDYVNTSTDGATSVQSTDSAVLKGQNANTSIKTGTTAQVPTKLMGNGTLLETAGTQNSTTIPSAEVDSFTVLSLNTTLSKASNDAADTLAAAVTRVSTALTAH